MPTTIAATQLQTGPSGALDPTGSALLPSIGSSTFVAAVAYDPEGDDGQENNDQAAFVLDADRGTGWSTSCYASMSLGGKTGVGVVVTLPAPHSRHGCSSTSPVRRGRCRCSPRTNEAIPDSIVGWGAPVATDSATEPDYVTVPLTGAARHVLVLMQEGGPTDQCPADLPYRATITEVQLEAIS